MPSCVELLREVPRLLLLETVMDREIWFPKLLMLGGARDSAKASGPW